MKAQKYILGGWTRLGIVITLLWTAVVFFWLWAELQGSPMGTGFITNSVVTSTGEPVSVVVKKTGPFADIVLKDNVHRTVNVQNLLIAILLPVLPIWIVGSAAGWIIAGFRRTR
jgi:hypothetical protein